MYGIHAFRVKGLFGDDDDDDDFEFVITKKNSSGIKPAAQKKVVPKVAEDSDDDVSLELLTVAGVRDVWGRRGLGRSEGCAGGTRTWEE